MPHSYDFFNNDVKDFVYTSFPSGAKILDVGCGAGKYGKLLKERYSVDALEVFEPYIKEFNLNSIYQNVYNKNVKDLTLSEGQYSLAIMGDILEHLTVGEAQAVVDNFTRNKVSLLVLVPYSYPQGIMHDNEHEIHQQPDLTEAIFNERYPNFIKIFGNTRQGVFYKRG